MYYYQGKADFDTRKLITPGVRIYLLMIAFDLMHIIFNPLSNLRQE